jgi:hypothetical protein
VLANSEHAPSASALFVVGAGRELLPIGSCMLLVQAGGPLVASLTEARGRCRLPVPLANVPGLVGFRAVSQVWKLDAMGLRATSGVEVTIGL